MAIWLWQSGIWPSRWGTWHRSRSKTSTGYSRHLIWRRLWRLRGEAGCSHKLKVWASTMKHLWTESKPCSKIVVTKI